MFAGCGSEQLCGFRIVVKSNPVFQERGLRCSGVAGSWLGCSGVSGSCSECGPVSILNQFRVLASWGTEVRFRITM